MKLDYDSKIETSNTQDDKTLNINPEEFWPKRSAATVVEQRTRGITDNKKYLYKSAYLQDSCKVRIENM